MDIKNINGEYMKAEIVRYFNNNDNEYLIYLLKEVDEIADEAGYVKLYASKIIDNKSCIISDNDEWNEIKQIIKDIVRNNRDGSPLNIIDLDEENLNNIVLQDARIFKLQGNLVTLLSENKKVIKPQAEEEPIQDEIIEENIDYELLYNEQLKVNEDLNQKINDLTAENELYKEKISKIKEIIETE